MNRLDAFLEGFRDYFKSGTRNVADSASAFIRGLFVAERSNLQQISESIDDAGHQNLQYLVSEAKWDHQAVQRKIAQGADALLGGHDDSVLIIDESGFTKKGECSVGVRRQWNGRLGKVDNCQVGVFAALSHGIGVALIDARLYLPKEWTESKRRCDKAHIPTDCREFKTKSQIALEMIRNARAQGLRFAFVGGDAGYGREPAFLRAVEDLGEKFMVDVHSNQRIFLDNPSPEIATRKGTSGRIPKALVSTRKSVRVDTWMKKQPKSAWQSLQVRHATTGPITVDAIYRQVWLWNGTEEKPRRWTLLIVRNPTDHDDLHYALTNAAEDTKLLNLVQIERQRFWIEHALGDAKSEIGMAQYEVRSWIGWHRHMTLCMMANLFSVMERVRVASKIPLLSARDVRCVIAEMIVHPEKARDKIYKIIASRQKQRWASTENRYKKAGLNPSYNSLVCSTK